MDGWIWGVVGAIVGTVGGITGAAIGTWNSKRMVRGEESFLKMKKWNVYDFFYTFLIIVGLLALIGSLLLIEFQMTRDAFPLSLFSLVFLFIGCLNAVIRVRALQT